MKKSLLLILLQILTFALIAQNDSINVLHYKLYLTLSNQAYSVRGIATITLTTQHHLKNLKLDLVGKIVDSVIINKHKVPFKLLTSQIQIDHSLQANDTVKVTVYYRGLALKDSKWGGYNVVQNTAYFVGIGMESEPLSVARFLFPTNDLFHDKATFDVYITVDKGLTAISVGKLISKKDSISYTIWHWKIDQPISPYLFTVVVGDFKQITDTYHSITGRSIPIQIYFRNQLDSNKVKQTFKNLKEAVELFEQLFGPYQWDKIGYVLVPGFFGGMESATAIILSEDVIYSDDPVIIYHELSHSWFGNLVTAYSPSDIWLNEGWASYCEYIYKENLESRTNAFYYIQTVKLQDLNFTYKKDNGYHPIANIQHNLTYSKTIYDKGMLVVHTLRGTMGDKQFFEATKNYLNHFKFKSVTIDSLKNFFQKYTTLNLDNFFNFWLNSSGYPIFLADILPTDTKNKWLILIEQQKVGDTILMKNLPIQVAILLKNNQILYKLVNITGKWTYDTIETKIKPIAVILDPFQYLTSASIGEFVQIPKKYNWILFDLELFELKISKLKKDNLPFYAEAIWKYPEDTIINNNLLLQTNYYWHIATNDRMLKASAIFHLTTLMDINFQLQSAEELQKRLKLLYKPNPWSKWQEANDYYLSITSESSTVILKRLKSGYYILALQR